MFAVFVLKVRVLSRNGHGLTEIVSRMNSLCRVSRIVRLSEDESDESFPSKFREVV